jgi:hypothetical protein
MSRIAKLAAIAAGASAVVLSGTGLAMADAGAKGAAVDSPGIVSGDVVEAPIDAQADVCGDEANVIAAANPSSDNVCLNSDDDSSS